MKNSTDKWSETEALKSFQAKARSKEWWKKDYSIFLKRPLNVWGTEWSQTSFFFGYQNIATLSLSHNRSMAVITEYFEIELRVRKIINLLNGQSLFNFVVLKVQFGLHTKARGMFGNGNVMVSLLIKHLHENCHIFIMAYKAQVIWLLPTTWPSFRPFAQIPLLPTPALATHTLTHSWALLTFLKHFSGLPCFSLTVGRLHEMASSTETSSRLPLSGKLILNLLICGSSKRLPFSPQMRTDHCIIGSHS